MDLRFYIQGVNCWLLVYLLRTSQSIQEWTKKNLRKVAFKFLQMLLVQIPVCISLNIQPPKGK